MGKRSQTAADYYNNKDKDGIPMKVLRHKLIRITLLTFSIIIFPASAEERIELDGMSIIGNSELPKALFIVPWKQAIAGTIPGRPVNSLIEETLQPVDPDVFRRKIQYFNVVRNTEKSPQ